MAFQRNSLKLFGSFLHHNYTAFGARTLKFCGPGRKSCGRSALRAILSLKCLQLAQLWSSAAIITLGEEKLPNEDMENVRNGTSKRTLLS